MKIPASHQNPTNTKHKIHKLSKFPLKPKSTTPPILTPTYLNLGNSGVFPYLQNISAGPR